MAFGSESHRDAPGWFEARVLSTQKWMLSLLFFRLSRELWNRTWNRDDVDVECIKRSSLAGSCFHLASITLAKA